MRLTMVLVLVIAAVAFSYGGIGFGTGALQVIAEEPAAPMVLTVFGGIDLGSYQVGARAVGFSWHTGYPEGEQTYVGSRGSRLQGEGRRVPDGERRSDRRRWRRR